MGPGPGPGPRPGPSHQAKAAVLLLTRRWRLQLGLLLGLPSAEDFGRRLLPTLGLALKGKQVLDILLFQGACCAARRANIQVGCQLTPLLVFINLAKKKKKKKAGSLVCSNVACLKPGDKKGT